MNQHPKRGPTLGERLERARERAFVGRVAEQELWAAALASASPDFSVLWLHGPGGIGKSALLARMSALTLKASRTPIQLDARRLSVSADAFHVLLRETLGLRDDEEVQAALHDGSRRALLIDTAEILGPLEDWLRTEFFPSLPADLPVAIAGRHAPSAAWRSDPGWSELLRVVALRNLAPSDSRALLSLRGVPSEHHAELTESTHGHPLALSLIADLAQQSGVETALVGPARSGDILPALLERFSARAPDHLHRQALYVAAHSRVTTEALLREVVDAARAGALYDWLCELSFAERGPAGVFLHELAAECIDAEHRSRDPEQYATTHMRIRAAIIAPMLEARGATQLRAASDFAWMHRYSPFMSPLVDWNLARASYFSPLTEADVPELLEATRRFHGEAPAAAARFWLGRQPEAFTIVRSSPLKALGYICTLKLEHTDSEIEAADPRIAAGFQHARAQGPLREGDLLSFMFWVGYVGDQEPRPMLAHLTSRAMLHWIGSPRMAFSFHFVTDLSTLWLPFHAYIEHHPGPTVAFGKTPTVLAGHDWRRMPLDAFLTLMNERELHGGFAAPPPEQSSLFVLSQEAFSDAIRQALRDLLHPDKLATNALCRCRVTIEAPHSNLRNVIERAVQEALPAAKDEKLRNALALTYLTPTPTQELAAERLGLPFSTYRRHLSGAVERIVEWLWQRELHGWA